MLIRANLRPEIEQTLQAFEARVKSSAQAKMEKDAADNEAKGKEYREKLPKRKVKPLQRSGLQVVEAGKGEAPKDSDTVVVNYKGTLIDGKEFDNSYTRGEPLLSVWTVYPGWTEV
ncbi:FKBP-type peptidyl-prolyl isomerase [Escherichia coli]|uniref:Peptidyl-prolyl cis-trans isomerase n=1 Tax=Escherichia coli TaxID=562 RepID=A0A376RBP2_ECOLX|nr:FKBP-type peptidyl-prolyl isomerase [Escherichia coli]